MSLHLQPTKKINVVDVPISPEAKPRAGLQRIFMFRCSFLAMGVAKNFVRFEVALYRHSGVGRNPVFSIPRNAGLDPAFTGVTGREKVTIFGNYYNRKIQ